MVCKEFRRVGNTFISAWYNFWPQELGPNFAVTLIVPVEPVMYPIQRTNIDFISLDILWILKNFFNRSKLSYYFFTFSHFNSIVVLKLSRDEKHLYVKIDICVTINKVMLSTWIKYENKRSERVCAGYLESVLYWVERKTVCNTVKSVLLRTFTVRNRCQANTQDDSRKLRIQHRTRPSLPPVSQKRCLFKYFNCTLCWNRASVTRPSCYELVPRRYMKRLVGIAVL